MTPQQANEQDNDYSMDDVDLARKLLTLLGYSISPSREPGADWHVDRMAPIIAAWNRRAPAPTSEQDAAELAEWRRLKDPAVLHASLLRGQPARLPDDVFQHIAGVAPTSELGPRDAVLEEAAAACDALESDLFDQYKGRGKHDQYNPGRANPETNGQSDGAGQCAVAIRALKCATPASPTTVCAPNCFYGDCPPCVEAGIAPASPAVPAAPLAPSYAMALLRSLIVSEVGKQTLDKLAAGQGTATADGKNWLAAKALTAADPAPLVAQASPNRYSYRKRPVVIEAFQFQRRNNGLIPYPDWYDDAVTRNDIITRNTGKWHDPTTPAYCEIKTLEGVMRADEGDWIIRGVKGEMYPCKPDIFALSYEPAAPEASPLVEDAQHFYTFTKPEGWINLQNSGQSWEQWTKTQGLPTTSGWKVFGTKPVVAQRIVAGKVAAHDVLAERQRQQDVEGWTPAHDDAYRFGELGIAALCYLRSNRFSGPIDAPIDSWPWPHEWWKPTTRRRNLIKAGALIIAEIERMDRATNGNATADDGKDK